MDPVRSGGPRTGGQCFRVTLLEQLENVPNLVLVFILFFFVTAYLFFFIISMRKQQHKLFVNIKS